MASPFAMPVAMPVASLVPPCFLKLNFAKAKLVSEKRGQFL